MGYSVTLTKEQLEAARDSITHYSAFLVRLIALCDSKETDLNPADVFKTELHNISALRKVLTDGQQAEAHPLG